MLRPLTVALSAANVLFLAWTAWVAEPADPAKRVTVPVTAQAAKPVPVASASAASRCVSLGPFGDAAVAATVYQRLAVGGLAARARSERQQHRDGYWVWVAASGASQQRQVLAQIRRVGIQDAVAMPDDPQFRISLGLYSERARADQRSKALQPLGLAPHVEEHFQERAVEWLDVPEAGDRLSASRLESFGIDTEIGAFDCPAP